LIFSDTSFSSRVSLHMHEQHATEPTKDAKQVLPLQHARVVTVRPPLQASLTWRRPPPMFGGPWRKCSLYDACLMALQKSRHATGHARMHAWSQNGRGSGFLHAVHAVQTQVNVKRQVTDGGMTAE